MKSIHVSIKPWKYILLTGVAVLMTGGVFPVQAIGNICMDEHADIQAKQYKKVVIFPLRYKNAPDGKVEEFQGYNQYLYKDIKKRVKKTNFIGFGEQIDEKKHILRDNKDYEALTRHFDSEEERAKAVYTVTAADGYLLPHIRWEKERVDTSPATWTTLKMESYYNIIDGPDGDKYKVNYKSWNINHLIPEQQRTMQMLDMDFTLYDAYTGKKAMTRIDYYRHYDASQWGAVKALSKRFADDWYKMRKDKDNKVPAGAPTLGFRNFNLPYNVGNDEFAIKTIYYAIKDEAGDRLKGVKVDYSPNGGQYYVTGDVTYYDRGETWNPPVAYISPSKIRTEKFTWKDKDGNEHEGKREYYLSKEEDIIDVFGYNSIWYKVAMNLRLVDAATGNVVYSESGEDVNDYYADALRAILKKFYNHVDELIGVKEK